MGGLYQSGWNPPGARKAWDRCSMESKSTEHFLGNYHKMAGGEIVEAVGWFDDDGAVKAVVADYDNGKRLIARMSARTTKVTFERLSAARQADRVMG